MWLFCLLGPFIPTQIKFLATPLMFSLLQAATGFVSATKNATQCMTEASWQVPTLYIDKAALADSQLAPG